MSVSQNEKATRFQALHEGVGVFVIPNPWDVAPPAFSPALASRRWPRRALHLPLRSVEETAG